MRRFSAALLAVVLAAGCGSGAVVVRDARYRVTLNAVSPTAPGEVGELRLRVETRGGWHVAPEAPARLDLEAPESIAFEPASLDLEHAETVDKEFELATALRAERAGRSTAHGRLKFGICREKNGICVAVDQPLELPIEVSFQ